MRYFITFACLGSNALYIQWSLHFRLVLTERRDRIRVVTAYDMDAGHKWGYLARRLRGGISDEKEND